MEPIAVAIVGAVGVTAAAFVGAWFSRRYGLPGLAREIQTQQAALILTLNERVDSLEGQVTELESCRSELKAVRRRLTEAEADLVDIYRKTGTPKPRHPQPLNEAAASA